MSLPAQLYTGEIYCPLHKCWLFWVISLLPFHLPKAAMGDTERYFICLQNRLLPVLRTLKVVLNKSHPIFPLFKGHKRLASSGTGLTPSTRKGNAAQFSHSFLTAKID